MMVDEANPYDIYKSGPTVDQQSPPAQTAGVKPPTAETENPYSAYSTPVQKAGLAMPKTDEEWAAMPWSEVGKRAIASAPSSAMQTGEAIIHPFTHWDETKQALGQLGTGLYSKAQGLISDQPDTEEKARKEAALDAALKAGKARFGELTSEAGLKRSLATDPVGTAMDVSMPFTLGETALAKAPGVLGKISEASGTISKFTDPVRIATAIPQKALELGTGTTAAALSLKSGASVESLKQAAKAGMTADPTFWEHWAGSAKPNDLVDHIESAIKMANDEKLKNYTEGMADQSKLLDPLNYNLIDDAIANRKKSNTFINNKQEKLGLDATLNEIESHVNEWKNQPFDPKNPQGQHSIRDLDGLKKRLDELYDMYPPGSPQASAVSDVRKSVYNTIAQQDSGYAQIMRDYGDASDKIRDFRKTLLGSPTAATATSVKNLVRAQKTGAGRNLLQDLAEYDPSIPYRIAGTELHEAMPMGMRGYISAIVGQMGLGHFLGAFVHPMALPALALSSPRVAGALQYGLGTPGLVTGPVKAAGEAGAAAARLPYELGQYEERPQRAFGGRIGSDAMADKLVRAAEVAKKSINLRTEHLLNQPDETIAKALDVAKRHI